MKRINEKFIECESINGENRLSTLQHNYIPLLTGVINYYWKFSKRKMNNLWRGLNAKLIKWVRWEKRLYKLDAIRWLKLKWKEKPTLFPHWTLVHP